MYNCSIVKSFGVYVFQETWYHWPSSLEEELQDRKLHSKRWCLVVGVAKLVDAVALTMYGSDEMEMVNGLTLYNWGRNHSL